MTGTIFPTIPMTLAFIKFYYGITLAACLTIAGEMALVEYRGLILPSGLMCFVFAALAGVLFGDWLVQNCIKHRSIG